MARQVTRQRKSDRPTPVEVEAPVPAPEPARPRAPREPARAARAAAPPRLDTPIDMDDLASIANMSAEELAALMDGEALSAGPKIGEQVTGTIVRISRDVAFVDLGAKSEGQVALEELADPQLGDTLTAYVLDIDEMGVRLSQRLSGAAAVEFLDEAVTSGTPVEGLVLSHNKGGFDVRIGSIRAFCPMSQMERIVDADRDTYVGKTFTFRVLETGEKIVVSRRAILDANLEDTIDAFWAKISEGDVFEGVVSSVQKFGVFVDLGGVDGLVPQRELSWDPSTNVQRGQRLEVRVLQIDRGSRKLTLSAKDPGMSPWSTRVGTEFIVGGTYSGNVSGVEAFGAFVTLAPGLQGLLHVSRAGGALPAIGDAIDVRVTDIDEARQRIGLAATTWQPVEGDVPSSAPEETVTGTVRDVVQNGVLIDLDDGRTGWLPAREVDLPAGTVLSQRFRRGRKVTARVKELDRRSERLTLTQHTDPSDTDSSWRAHQAAAPAQGFGTMAALFGELKK